MNVRARLASRLPTATRVAFSARQIAFQFLRAMLAVPRMPQRQTAGMCGFSRSDEWGYGRWARWPRPGTLVRPACPCTPFMTPALLLAALSVGAPADPDYLRDVKPLLMKKCSACHGAVRQKAGLRLDAAPLILKGNKGGPVVVPSKPDESRLVEMVADDPVRMPPKGEGEPLSAKEIELVREWIRLGARM